MGAYVQLDIMADCMEHMSDDDGDLWKFIDQVVLQLHNPPFSKKHGIN